MPPRFRSVLHQADQRAAVGDKLAHLPGFALLLLQLAPDRLQGAGGIERSA
jgi:hypothetical protein